jgi:hypothetical protein
MLPRNALIPIVSAAAETTTQRVTSRAQVKTSMSFVIGFPIIDEQHPPIRFVLRAVS